MLLLFDSASKLAVMQSRVHEFWARFFSSSFKDDLRYNTTDCFDNFPFPADGHGEDQLCKTGESYYLIRSELMISRNEGLTKTYNRFHDPHEKSSEILHLRELHDAMDRAVLKAYGWDDLAATARCEFLLDYEEEGTGDSEVGDLGEENQSLITGPKSRRKLPWRLRWPDEFRDEVLARLLELNEQRHKEELLVGSSKSLEKEKEKKATSATKRKKNTGPSLFGDDD